MKKLFNCTSCMSGFLLLLVMFVGNIHAQVTVSTSHLPLDQLNLADIDFQTGGSRNWYFTINASGPPTASLELSVDVQLADANFPNAISFTTETFTLPLTFTNLDIGPNSAIKIQRNTSVEFNADAKNRLQNEALATGKLPAGTYTFRLNFKDILGNPIPVQGNNTIGSYSQKHFTSRSDFSPG